MSLKLQEQLIARSKLQILHCSPLSCLFCREREGALSNLAHTECQTTEPNQVGEHKRNKGEQAKPFLLDFFL